MSVRLGQEILKWADRSVKENLLFCCPIIDLLEQNIWNASKLVGNSVDKGVSCAKSKLKRFSLKVKSVVKLVIERTRQLFLGNQQK